MENKNTLDELKEELKGAIRRFFFEDELAIRDVWDISGRIRNILIPYEEVQIQEDGNVLHEQPAEESTANNPEAEDFIGYCNTTKMAYSYKMLLIMAFLKNADAEGNMKIDDAVSFFRAFYDRRREQGKPVEKAKCIYLNPEVTDDQIRKNIVINPVKVLSSGGFFVYDGSTGILKIRPETWMALGDADKKTAVEICEKRLEEYYKD